MNRYIGAVITGVLILGTATAVSAQDWPQWRGINRDGKVEGFKAPETWPDTTKLDRFGSVIDAGSVLMGLSPKSELIVFKPESRAYTELAR